MSWHPARHFTPSRLARVDLLVLHTAEGARDVAGLGRYFATTDRRASAHSGVDDDRTADYVRDEHTAYAAPGANADGLHLELCGFARWSRETWLTEHAGMCERAAVWLAERAARHGVPLRLLGPAELVADQRGVTTHDAVTRAFRRSTHTDPGPGCPVDVILARAQALATSLAPGQLVDAAPRRQAPEWPGRVLRPGSRGPDVLAWQRRMRQRGWTLAVDGVYGPRTARVARAFQQDKQLPVDGLVGPVTWRAAWSLPITP